MEPSELLSRKAIVLFDDHCRICRAFARILTRLDRGRRMELVGFTDAIRSGLDRGFSHDAFHQSFHVLDEGRRWSGPEAIPQVLDRIPGGGRLVRALRRVPGADRINRKVYGWVARNRYRLGCGRPGCSLHPSSP